jgi:hypothetical protein
VIDPAVCYAAPEGFMPIDGELVYGTIEDGGDVSIEGWDPAWAYRTLAYNAGEEGVEGELVDPPVLYSAFEDFVPVDGEMFSSSGDETTLPELIKDGELDPSWLYRNAIADGALVVDQSVVEDGVIVEDELVDSDGNGIPDALDCGIAVKEGDAVAFYDQADTDGNGEPDDVVMYAIDPIAEETVVDVDADGNPVDAVVDPVRYLGGPQFRGAVETKTTDDGEESPVDVAMSSNEEPVAVEGEVTEVGPFAVDANSETNDLPLDVMFFSMNSVGGSEVQRTLESIETPVVVNSAPAVISTSLFQSQLDLSSVGTLIAASEGASVQASVRTTSSAPITRSKSTSLFPLDATKVSNDLEGLSPLLEGEDETTSVPVPESTATETAVGEEAVNLSGQKRSAGTPVTSARVSKSQSDVEATQRSRQAVKIDQIMTEFAQNSFMS